MCLFYVSGLGHVHSKHISSFSEGELASGELGLMKEDGGQLVVGEGGLKLKDGPVPCESYSCLLTAQQVSGGTASGGSG